MLSQTNLPITITPSCIQDQDVRALLAQSQPGAVSFYPTEAMIYAHGDAVGQYVLERVLQVAALLGARGVEVEVLPGAAAAAAERRAGGVDAGR